MVDAIKRLVAKLIAVATSETGQLDTDIVQLKKPLPPVPPMASLPPVTDIVCLDPADPESRAVVAAHAAGDVPTVVTKVVGTGASGVG
jgi:hypothetical protein